MREVGPLPLRPKKLLKRRVVTHRLKYHPDVIPSVVTPPLLELAEQFHCPFAVPKRPVDDSTTPPTRPILLHTLHPFRLTLGPEKARLGKFLELVHENGRTFVRGTKIAMDMDPPRSPMTYQWAPFVMRLRTAPLTSF